MQDAASIFDAAMRFSDQVHRAHRRREVWVTIGGVESTCGSCRKWMTDACPRERRDRFGTKVGGPSCAAIKCGEFVMSRLSEKTLAGLWTEYESLGGVRRPSADAALKDAAPSGTAG